MSDDEQLVEAAWAALLRGNWRFFTRAASKLPMDKLLALHSESRVAHQAEWAYVLVPGTGRCRCRCRLVPVAVMAYDRGRVYPGCKITHMLQVT
jgi:hypothetical protein